MPCAISRAISHTDSRALSRAASQGAAEDDFEQQAISALLCFMTVATIGLSVFITFMYSVPDWVRQLPLKWCKSCYLCLCCCCRIGLRTMKDADAGKDDSAWDDAPVTGVVEQGSAGLGNGTGKDTRNDHSNGTADDDVKAAPDPVGVGDGIQLRCPRPSLAPPTPRTGASPMSRVGFMAESPSKLERRSSTAADHPFDVQPPSAPDAGGVETTPEAHAQV